MLPRLWPARPTSAQIRTLIGSEREFDEVPDWREFQLADLPGRLRPGLLRVLSSVAASARNGAAFAEEQRVAMPRSARRIPEPPDSMKVQQDLTYSLCFCEDCGTGVGRTTATCGGAGLFPGTGGLMRCLGLRRLIEIQGVARMLNVLLKLRHYWLQEESGPVAAARTVRNSL